MVSEETFEVVVFWPLKLKKNLSQYNFYVFFVFSLVKNLPLQTPPLPLMHVFLQFPIDEQLVETRKHGFSKVSLFFQILYLKPCFVQEEAVQQFSSRMKKYKMSRLYFLVIVNK